MKKTSCLLLAALAVPVLPAAPSVSLQPSVGQASAHLPASLAHLDFGGEVFAYYDVDGELEGLTESFAGLYGMIRAASQGSGQQMPEISKGTLAEALRILGLFDPKALGQSSVKLADGRYLNKTFLYTPKGRTGLLRAVGGEAHAFESLSMAPANTQLIVEMDLDGQAVLETLKSLALSIGGRATLDQLEAALNQPNKAIAGTPTPQRIISALKTHVTVIVAADIAKTFKPDPSGPDLPTPHSIVLVDGLASLLHPVLKNATQHPRDGDTVTETETRFTVESQPLNKTSPIAPIVDLDLKGGQVRLATSRAFLESTLAKTGGFAQTEAYKSLSAHLPKTGNTLVCMNLTALPSLLDEVEKTLPAGQKKEAGIVLAYARGLTAPSMTTLSNLPEGILITSNSPFSHKNQLMGAGSVVAVGLVSAMAIPAFTRVRNESLRVTVINDGRQIGSAAQQYFLTTGKEVASFEYDPVTGKIKGDLAPWLGTIGKGYTVHDNIIESGNTEAFSFSHPDAFGGKPVVFTDEGKTTVSPSGN